MSAARKRRKIFVGDVQGCADELEDLLEAIPFDPEADSLFFVGDLVNRGPASARVLRRAIALGAESVLGNHDLHLLGRVSGEHPARPRDTLDDVLDAADRDQLVGWLRERPLVVELPNLFLVHAGLHPSWTDPRKVAGPLEEAIRDGRIPWNDPDLQFLTRVRHCTANGARPENEERPGPGFAPWDTFYGGLRKVVFGHWAARGLVVTERVRGLDSGCVWGGRLTAWIAEEDRIVSVPARRAYQPRDG